MHERRRPESSDIHGAEHGDFTAEPAFPDWDNPEDYDDDAPEGYYDEEEEDEDDGTYVPGPEDPDYDLSEAAGYAGWEEPRSSRPFPQWLIALISIGLIISFLLPAILRAR